MGAWVELIARMEGQVMAADFWIDPSQLRMLLADGGKINLPG